MQIHVPILRFLHSDLRKHLHLFFSQFLFKKWSIKKQYKTFFPIKLFTVEMKPCKISHQKNPWNNSVTVVYGTCISSKKSALIPKNITLIDTE